jgi:hypothetical protein
VEAEVIGQPLVGRLDEFLQQIAGDVSILVVDRLDAGPVRRQQFASEQVEPLAQQHELTKHRFKGGAIVGGNRRLVLKSGFSVRNWHSASNRLLERTRLR